MNDTHPRACLHTPVARAAHVSLERVLALKPSLLVLRLVCRCSVPAWQVF